MAQTVLFDATRLLQRWDRSSPTGIDRVVVAYARWLTSRQDITVVPIANLRGSLAELPRARLDSLLEEAVSQSGIVEETPTWRRLLPALRTPPDGGDGLRTPSSGDKGAGGWLHSSLAAILRAGARPLRPFPPGSIYLNVGHSGFDRPELLRQIVNRGARPVVMIHDLIPIRFPEFCGPSAAERHTRRIASVLDEATLIIANSNDTAVDIDEYARRLGVSTPEICVAHLGLERSFLEEPPRLLPGHPYFVSVGTIEARKNLAFLLTLWRRLAERMGPATPRLVLVGRRGWENEAVIDHLERSPAVRALVHEVCDLRDAEVACLMRGSHGLLAPSFAEGFDLPVIEAMSLSTPVIASDIRVHRELAKGSKLMDPLDGLGWLNAIESASHARPTPPPFAPPTWSQHFARVGEAMGLDPNDRALEHSVSLGRL